MKKIAIDGPAGAGKSTVAKALAKRLNYHYLDTGAMYRAAAYYMIQNHVDPSDMDAVKELLPSMQMEITYVDSIQKIIINGKDVTPHVRTAEISRASSAIAVNSFLRKKLVNIQREVANHYDLVMDGRDIGTYVLPDADYKFFITASIDERARRRFLEETNTNSQVTVSSIKEDIKKRDANDSSRKFAPLKQADDAILVDTTNMSIEEVVAFLAYKITGGN